MAAKTSVFDHMGDRWLEPMVKDVRPISTVILDERIKRPLLQDVRDFLDPTARERYRGTPYRRSYLFHGPSGAGKTSLAFSIAGYFGLDIYAISLSGIDAACLKALFAELPGRCIILLEDIEVNSSILLDVIDGVGDGHVLIMTTRHIELLDGALMQPGRVDVETEFGLADKETITRLFYLVFQDDEAVDLLANQFAARIPELEFSPAEVVSFLIENRLSSQEAVGNTGAWMARVRDERKKMQGGA
jgi:chaperone BCS1